MSLSWLEKTFASYGWQECIHEYRLGGGSELLNQKSKWFLECKGGLGGPLKPPRQYGPGCLKHIYSIYLLTGVEKVEVEEEDMTVL